jgi:ABC-type branched-subunit amino acid transport system substrate-binding protein
MSVSAKRVLTWRRLLLIVVLLGTGCGSDNATSSSAAPTASAVSTAVSSAPASAAAASSTTATTPAAKGPATGEPIKVLQVTLDNPSAGLAFPEVKAAVKGRIDRLNANGGILGRPVQVDVCEAQFDPNKADACAQKAVDGKYLAVIGSQFPNGDNWQKILESAGIPNIGYTPLVPYDGQTKTGFPVYAGALSAVAGQARYLSDVASCKNIVMPHTDSVSGQAAVGYANEGLKSKGMTVTAQPVPRSKPDQSAEVQKAISGGDCILVAVTGADLGQFAGLLQSNGYPVDKMDYNEGSFVPAIRKALTNPVIEGFHVISQFPTDDMNTKGVQEYLTDQKAGDPSLVNSDSVAKGIWAGAELFAESASKLKAVDPSELLQILRSTTSFDADGMVPPIDFSKPGPLADQPSLRNFSVLYSVVKNGVISKTDGTFASSIG